MPAAISEYMPQLASDKESARRRRAAFVAWGAVVFCAALSVAAVVVAPMARAGGWPLLSVVIYGAFHAACHQMPERSFYVAGYPLAVCARCFGLYVGALAGLIAYPLVRPMARTDAPWRGWLLIASLPTTVDFALGLFGVWENTHWSRFSTALVAGAASAFYVVPGLVDLSLSKFRRPAEGFCPAGV
jgi:uncharacterized membrane protein